MRRNCNLELRLLPHSDDRQQPPMMEEIGRGNPQQKHREQQQQQPLTIFYNGKICVSDVTELQARAILLLATSEMEERLKITSTPTSGSEPSSPTSLQPHLYTPTAGLSMKRSLQRFLQKRKHRSQAASPYNH